MKCHLCVNYIEMQTDPATCDYLIVSGARRKEERWDMAENEQILTTGNVFLCLFGQHSTHPTFKMSLMYSLNLVFYFFLCSLSTLSIPERTEKEKLETDAMFKLDHEGKDKEKLKKALPSLTDIIDYQSRWKDDYQLNSSLRRKFRVEDSSFAGCCLPVREISWLRIYTHILFKVLSLVSQKLHHYLWLWKFFLLYVISKPLQILIPSFHSCISAWKALCDVNSKPFFGSNSFLKQCFSL